MNHRTTFSAVTVLLMLTACSESSALPSGITVPAGAHATVPATAPKSNELLYVSTGRQNLIQIYAATGQRQNCSVKSLAA